MDSSTSTRVQGWGKRTLRMRTCRECQSDWNLCIFYPWMPPALRDGLASVGLWKQEWIPDCTSYVITRNHPQSEEYQMPYVMWTKVKRYRFNEHRGFNPYTPKLRTEHPTVDIPSREHKLQDYNTSDDDPPSFSDGSQSVGVSLAESSSSIHGVFEADIASNSHNNQVSCEETSCTMWKLGTIPWNPCLEKTHK